MATNEEMLAEIFPGDSVMSQLMRAHDWAATPLGPAQHWPEGLKVPLGMMLTSRFEMWLGWGEDLAFFYNDAYVPTLGTKHPAALGQPMKQVWKEVFADVEDRIVSVMRDGVATWDKALRLILERAGFPEETYHTFSYSPLRGEGGAVRGLMCIVTEETERVISERRLETSRRLATALLPARTRHEVLDGTRAALGSNPADFPFSDVRLFDGSVALSGHSTPETSSLAGVPWPTDRLEGEDSIVVPLEGLLSHPPHGAWTAPPTHALLVALGGSDGHKLGFLVLGLNPYRPDHADMAGFGRLLASQIAGALARVGARARDAAEAARLRNLFEQSPSFVAVMRGPDHVFELTNAAYAQLVAGRDVIGKPVRDALPELQGQDFFELLDRVYASGEPFVGKSAPIRLQVQPDAAPDERFLDFVYQPIRGPDGAVSGIFVEGFDVTETHRTLLALRESEEQFRTFAEAMPNHIWTATPDGELDWFNQQTYLYTGAASDALQGTNWVSVVHPDDREQAGHVWAEALHSGDTYEVEFRIRGADGGYKWHLVRALPIRDDQGTILRWIGSNTDIHEQKLAQAESKRDRNRIWASTTDLMGTAGVDGYLKAVNPAWERLLGYSEQDLLSRPFLDIIDPADHHTMAESVGRLAAGKPVTFEDHLVHKDGSRSLVSWTAEPNGDHFYIVGRNVTDQRAAEEALRQAQKMEAVGQLTGGIAHDFNNLLTGIMGSLELLQTRIAQGRLNELDRYINAAQGASRRAAALTHRLLAFSRRQTLAPKPTNINRLVADMEELIRRTVGPSIDIEVIGAVGLWPALVDPNQLENALLNLCINARDAMPEGGKITIETGNKWLDERAARERDLVPGQFLSLCVTDTGSGMTPEVIKRAFDPFFTTKPLGQGTGLGLSMIYGFVRQSGGQIRVYSELGQGTTMCLYFPRNYSSGDDPELPEITEGTRHTGQGQSVLVVDDEPTVRMLVTEMLEDLGYAAIEAADGSAALRVLQSDIRIDLLVTDVGLPGGMNGRQVADAGRAIRPDLKVLFITGYAENAAVGHGHLEPGMQVVTKPFVIEALASRIKQMISDDPSASSSAR